MLLGFAAAAAAVCLLFVLDAAGAAVCWLLVLAAAGAAECLLRGLSLAAETPASVSLTAASSRRPAADAGSQLSMQLSLLPPLHVCCRRK